MKLHAAALALSWTLIIPQLYTCPKNAETCVHIAVLYSTITTGFATKKECWDAAVKWQVNFICDAEKDNLDIDWPSPDDPIECVEEDNR
jgi:hypothetical protein